MSGTAEKAASPSPSNEPLVPMVFRDDCVLVLRTCRGREGPAAAGAVASIEGKDDADDMAPKLGMPASAAWNMAPSKGECGEELVPWPDAATLLCGMDRWMEP